MSQATTTDLERFVLAVITDPRVRDRMAEQDFRAAFELAGLAPPTAEQVEALQGLEEEQLRALAKSFGFPNAHVN